RTHTPTRLSSSRLRNPVVRLGDTGRLLSRARRHRVAISRARAAVLNEKRTHVMYSRALAIPATLLTLVVAVACGDGGSPVAPTNPAVTTPGASDPTPAPSPT